MIVEKKMSIPFLHSFDVVLLIFCFKIHNFFYHLSPFECNVFSKSLNWTEHLKFYDTCCTEMCSEKTDVSHSWQRVSDPLFYEDLPPHPPPILPTLLFQILSNPSSPSPPYLHPH